MRRLAVFLALACGCAASPATTARVYVSNERDGTISVIDQAGDSVVATWRVGARVRGIRLSADGRTLYAARSTPLRQPYRPEDNRIVAIDTRTGRITRELDAGGDPEQLALLPGDRLVTSNEDAGTATIFDLRSERPAATLVTGIEPEGVTASPDGRLAYVTAETSNTVTVIDARRDSVIATFIVGARPRDVAFSPDGARAWVSSEMGRSLTVVDTRTSRVLRTIPLRLPGDVKPMGVQVSPDGARVFVALGRANAVAVLDAASDSVIAVVPAGTRVWGIGLSADGSTLYAAGGLSNDVTVIDTRTLRARRTIRAGDGPWGVAITR